MSTLRDGFLCHVAQTSASPIGLEIVRAEGSWLYTADGRRYLDLIAGIGVSALGHGHPAVLEAVSAQARRHLHVMVYGEYVIEAQVRLAERLTQLLPPALDCVYFTNSGAEAIEGALKTARKHTRRERFVAFDGAYHGDTMAALALMGNPAFRAPFEPLPGPVSHLPYGDAATLEAIDSTVAAVVIEPVQAEGGVRIPAAGFMRALRERCDRMGAILIYDEVLTGMGRTGRLFAMEHFGVVPDLVVMAKALGGGLPLGAFCGSGRLLIGVQFADSGTAEAFVRESLSRGVIINWTLNAERVVRLAPPLNMGAAEVDFALQMMAEALEAARAIGKSRL
jgi:acetylornithine/N-succinyldiaminopimelate aminotransferase